ncbi:MAG TPA: acylphosphatase [Usitatibacteraceae bacterium]|nr:acylphosphatase [Usitatibacteraceae bacterium]
MNEPDCRRLRIHGLVQGVGFRYSMQREALRLGLNGWVRNRRDGSVEAVVSGAASAVEAIVAWSRRGPPSAQVERVEVSIDEGRFDTFEQGPTA